jgi:hypothetical protein
MWLLGLPGGKKSGSAPELERQPLADEGSVWAALGDIKERDHVGCQRCREAAGLAPVGPLAARRRRPRSSPERERIRLGARLQERDLERPLAHRAALAHELVQAAATEHAVPVRVDVHAV